MQETLRNSQVNKTCQDTGKEVLQGEMKGH